MTTPSSLRHQLMVSALGALIGLAPVVAAPACVAGPTSSPASPAPAASDRMGEERAIKAVARSREAVQHRRFRQALEEIERAETALLNLDQVERDVHVDAALRRLDLARVAIEGKDLRRADQQLAEAAADLSVAVASTDADTIRTPSAMVPGDAIQPGQMRASDLIGDTVYDANDRKIGDVVDIVLDPDGAVAAVVIGVGDYVGVGGKNVAVPLGDIRTSADQQRRSLDRSQDQLRQAASYRLEGRDIAAGSSSDPGAESGAPK
jgi:sporulation protein YlmC with PRC-barrel domain